VPSNRRLLLTDLQFKTLYSEPENKAKHVLQGIFLSALILPRIAVQFIFNTFVLTCILIIWLFSSSLRKKALQQVQETFIDAPVRAVAVLWIPFDYVQYKKVYLSYGGEDD